MSTTIDIMPVKTTEITFGQVIHLSEKHINSFLKSVGIEQNIQLTVNIHDNNEKYKFDIKLSDKFEWKDNEYAWFTIKGIAGGTDAHCKKIYDPQIDPKNPWWQLDELIENNKEIRNIEDKLEKVKKLDRMWYFRRSAGQPGIINISYGLISASVAELTSGLLSSTDGAWNYEEFPVESDDFLSFYFKPEKAKSKDYAEWAKSCIDGIEEDLLRPTKYRNNGDDTVETEDNNRNLWSILKSFFS
ncbi:MAG: hypothetical protein R2798_00235 [Chitinophagales bacterium]|nr:hypothetical protein [Bacteroidota bacterium]MCB9043827.1 hypothetical protein [Chitinophagales bacterium]